MSCYDRARFKLRTFPFALLELECFSVRFHAFFTFKTYWFVSAFSGVWLKIDPCNFSLPFLLEMSGSGSDSESSSSPAPPNGGMMLRMIADGSTTVLDAQAPGYPVDLVAATPLLAAIQGLLARKQQENLEDEAKEKETGPKMTGSSGAAGSSTAMSSTQTEKEKDQEKDTSTTDGTSKKKKKKNQGKTGKKNRHGKKKH